MNKCPCCGYTNEKRYNPSKKIADLRRQRSKATKRLMQRVINVIQTNIPSENELLKEYYFYQSVSLIKDEQIDYGISRFIESNQYLKGKGFKYLLAIIQSHDKNKEIILKNELLMRGKVPSVVRLVKNIKEK